jgi:LysM repeat protein
MTGMTRLLLALVLGALVVAGAGIAACGGGGSPEKPGERITDPARVPSSTPIQNPTLYKIQGNEVLISGGASGQITPVVGNTPTTSDYTIKQGDFCSTIATDHHITLDEFLKVNRNVDCNSLHVGDRVKIPSAATATPTRQAISGNATPRPGGGSGAKTYTVQAGDTCAAIASSQGVALSAFMSANPSIDANCQSLKAGQTVQIP